MIVVKQFCVTGPRRDGDGYVRPTVCHSTWYASFAEALQSAREHHEQFGSAFAIWFRGRIVGLYDMRGHVPLCPEFR